MYSLDLSQASKVRPLMKSDKKKEREGRKGGQGMQGGTGTGAGAGAGMGDDMVPSYSPRV